MSKKLSFSQSFASNPKSEYWSVENKISPHCVPKRSNKKYKFDCPICHHTFEKSLNNNTFCPYCAHIRICDDNNCEFCFIMSFASISKSQYWSDENEISPRDVFKSSSKKYKFDCDICDHTFEMSLCHVTNGHFCPYCSNQKLCGDIYCESCTYKSFITHPKYKNWSNENTLSPIEVFKSSMTKYKFDCDICNHTFEIAPHHIIENKFCSYCASRRMCQDPQCNFCLQKSFASHPRSEFWSEQNEVSPRDVFKYSCKKYKFDCPNCDRSLKRYLNV